MDASSTYWKKCSSCKKEIGYLRKFYQCSVSTCNRQRTGLVFCSVSCFERHLPSAKHRDAYAVEETSPSYEVWQKEISPPVEENQPETGTAIGIETKSPSQETRRFITPKAREREILVVASKVKDYIRRHSEMNTSAEVLQVLSDHIRALCDEAIASAQESGRKTVMERDFKER